MVRMTCMTTKQKFDVEDPEVVMLANGRFAYKTPCPWEGKNGKQLTAFKFCSSVAYRDWTERHKQPVEEPEEEPEETEQNSDPTE